MAMNLTNLFTALGRTGRAGYMIASGQNGQGTPFTQLAGYAYVNPAWIASLTQSYDSLIRGQSQGMSSWTQICQTILQQFVTADVPAYGLSLDTSLRYLIEDMTAQGATFAACTVGKTVTGDSANVGTGVCAVSTTRYDGLVFQNTFAEESTLAITDDSYTGSATAGQEPWTWNGAANVSSLLTGTGVGLWDWDWPTGSGASATGNVVSADQDASTTGNLLTNSDFEDWTSGAASPPDYWAVSSGAWGTGVQRGATALTGTYSVEWVAGTGATPAITQQFDSSDSTGATAGTSATIDAYSTVFVNVWLRAAGVVTAGVLTVDLVDDAGSVINDQQGTPNSGTVTLSTLTPGDWEATTFEFRTKIVMPSIARLRIRISTALTGANVSMDDVVCCYPTQLYPGGPSAAVFAGGTDFEALPDPDAFTLTFTNNRAGASYGATWQTLMYRIFQNPDLIFPYNGGGTISDTLITGA